MAMLLLTHTPEMFDAYYGDAAFKGLQEVATVKRYYGEQPLSGAALIAQADGCQIVVSDRATPGSAALFNSSSELVAFVRCAVDIRTVDIEAASANGVLVTQASAGFVSAVSEWILGVMIDLARGISRAASNYHQGREPVAQMGVQLDGATLGIVGLGAIGSQLAKLGTALGMRVLGHDPFAVPFPSYAQSVDFETLLVESDFVVCLVVANESTENLFGRDAFDRMRASAYFVNASRGNLVNEDALHTALDRGVIAGAAIDVGRAADQKPSLELAGLSNVIATPHIGGLTPKAVAHQAFETVRQVSSILNGLVPPGAVNSEHAARLASLR